MLVTKKVKSAPPGNNNRYTKKGSHGTANRGNQFGVLADMHEDSAPHTNKNNTEKSRPISGSKSGSKGKAPIPRNNSQIPASSLQPATTVLHEDNDSNHGSRDTLLPPFPCIAGRSVDGSGDGVETAAAVTGWSSCSGEFLLSGMGSKIPGQTRRSRTWPPFGLEWEKKSCSVVSQTAWLRLSLNVWQSHINHLKHVQRSYKLNETLDIELQEERKSNNEALVRCKDLHEQLQRPETRPELPRRRIVRNFFYGSEEGAQIADLQGVDGGGVVMGRHEADEGESEMDGGNSKATMSVAGAANTVTCQRVFGRLMMEYRRARDWDNIGLGCTVLYGLGVSIKLELQSDDEVWSFGVNELNPNREVEIWVNSTIVEEGIQYDKGTEGDAENDGQSEDCSDSEVRSKKSQQTNSTSRKQQPIEPTVEALVEPMATTNPTEVHDVYRPHPIEVHGVYIPHPTEVHDVLTQEDIDFEMTLNSFNIDDLIPNGVQIEVPKNN
nr:filament-like plant protein 4 [Ipomoea batatas]